MKEVNIPVEQTSLIEYCKRKRQDVFRNLFSSAVVVAAFPARSGDNSIIEASWEADRDDYAIAVSLKGRGLEVSYSDDQNFEKYEITDMCLVDMLLENPRKNILTVVNAIDGFPRKLERFNFVNVEDEAIKILKEDFKERRPKLICILQRIGNHAQRVQANALMLSGLRALGDAGSLI